MKIEVKDYERVFELIGAIYFYGDFVAETVNERELEAILRKYGYFFETEKALIKKLHPDIDFDPPRKPEPPPSRLIRERDIYSKCPDCGSSRYKSNIFKITKYCIQPKCKNYYGRHKMTKKKKDNWWKRFLNWIEKASKKEPPHCGNCR